MLLKLRRICHALAIRSRRRWPFLADRSAVTAVEYAIIAGVMVTAIVVSVPAIGPELRIIFNNVAQSL